MGADEFEQGVFDLIADAKMENTQDCSNVALGLVKGLASVCGAFNQTAKQQATGVEPEADEEYTQRIADLLFETLDIAVWATNDFGFVNKPENFQAFGIVIGKLAGLKMNALQRESLLGDDAATINAGKCVADLIWALKKAHISAYLAFWFSMYMPVLSEELLESLTAEFSDHSVEADSKKLKEITDRLDSMFPHLKNRKKGR